MKKELLHPILLSGGFGTRLWPLSRTTLPKQLLALTSDHSMLQNTMLRLKDVPNLAAPSVICNHEHRFLIAEQLRQIHIDPAVVMLEPDGRNTAPAVTLAALYILEKDEDALLLVLPSDHVISDVAGFEKAIQIARELAANGSLVTFGVVPNKPETGYGYIQRGTPLDHSNTSYSVARFVEKPNRAKATEYLESGEYLWNSGIFLFSAQSLISEMELFAPKVVAACRAALAGSYSDLGFLRVEESNFGAAPAVSLDVAIMEKTERAVVVPIDIGWNDVGSWGALWEIHDKDAKGNVTSGNVVLQETSNCYVNAEKRLVALAGVEDLVVVETADAILITRQDHSQLVKEIVEQLCREGRTEQVIHRKVYRPWGSYEGVDRGDRFQVKRLIVSPGAKLSLQKHYHRSEHWIVVSGIAEVTLDEEIHLVAENESIYIPQGSLHRIHNPGKIELHMIEVQSGSYLGEDDIVRTDDTYGRVER